VIQSIAYDSYDKSYYNVENTGFKDKYLAVWNDEQRTPCYFNPEFSKQVVLEHPSGASQDSAEWQMSLVAGVGSLITLTCCTCFCRCLKDERDLSERDSFSGTVEMTENVNPLYNKT
jgi:hypothetical protein